MVAVADEESHSIDRKEPKIMPFSTEVEDHSGKYGH